VTGILTRALVKAACSPSPWDLGNQVLYDLCRKHPRHQDVPAILAKVWRLVLSKGLRTATNRARPLRNGSTGVDARLRNGPDQPASRVDPAYRPLPTASQQPALAATRRRDRRAQLAVRREHAVMAHQVHPRRRHQREARRRHRRAAHVAAQAFELRTLARLDLQARVQREPARLGCTVTSTM